MVSTLPSEPASASGATPKRSSATAFGCPRDFLDNRFVYTVVSPRARGLSIGVNLNPDKACNFDCIYCEVNRLVASPDPVLDVDQMSAELEETLGFAAAGRLRERPCYRTLPEDLLRLRHVALSGDGEPTLAPRFAEAMEAVIHLRARGRFPFFKIVLITNGSGLDRPEVENSLELFTPQDEVWAKLDAGTEEYLNQVNQPDRPLAAILASIARLGKRRSVVIQSLFPAINGVEPAPSEIEAYVANLQWLQAAGARISLVQVYSATRPTLRSRCGHLSLRQLSRIASRVREATGLRAEVF